MRHENLSIFLFATLFATATQHAGATTVCASSIAQINSAIALAAGDSTGMTIQVASGSYVLPSAGFDNAPAPALHDLSLHGGYDNDCSGHSNGAATTVFTSSAGAPLRLKANGNLRLSDMSFVGLQGTSELTLLGGQSDDLIVERASFRDSVSTSLLLQSSSGESGRISMQNVTVFGASNAVGCVVMVSGNAGKAVIANNTIADSNASMGLCLSGQQEKQAYANIIWNISGTDFVNTGSDVLSVRNLYGEFAGPLNPASTGDLNSAPAFVDPVAADYGLAPGSPAINSGGTFVPGGLASFDLQGGSRVKGSQVDRGALESEVSDLLIYTVTNTGDGASEDGDPGTLRRAISDANNAAQPAMIQFGIAGGCPQQIDIDRVLPAIAVPMIIDGSTQPGSTVNASEMAFDAHICVVIGASPSVASVPQALFVLAPNPTSVTVRGLGFSGIVSPLIFFSGSGHRVIGNQFGGSLPSGPLFVRLNPNNISIAFSGTSSSSIIGGPDRVDRNVIAGDDGFTGIGILVGGVQNKSTEVRNNLIGVNRGGMTAAPLGQGVVAVGKGHVIVDNRIGGCSTDGIRLATADHVTVQNNDIGGSMPNGVGIILNAGSSSNTIGAAAAESGRGNRITNNAGGAIWIDSTAGIFNRVRDNQLLVVEAPLGDDAMVLDLGEQGADANDQGDSDSGPNNRLNYPELASPLRANNILSFSASLDVPIGDYTLDVYTASSCLSNGRAMAERKLLSLNVSKPQSGVATVPVSLPADALNPSVLGATLTDSGGNTSELSNCLDVDRIFADGFE
ncbi:MAG: right-handed parallel beta-helix repeat-containing protein [Dokdonella sp.]